MKLVSACLLGIRCNWDEKDRYKNKKVIELLKKEVLIPICPEQLGGLKTPRIPQEIQKGDGNDVLDGKSSVKNKAGEDVTAEFIRGAEESLKIAKQYNIKEFIGKSKSPSNCSGQIGIKTSFFKSSITFLFLYLSFSSQLHLIPNRQALTSFIN